MLSFRKAVSAAFAVFLFFPLAAAGEEQWIQYKFDSGHSGYAPDRSLGFSLGLVGAVPLTDSIFTSPVVADGFVFVVDGSGVAFCFDSKTLKERWRFKSAGGAFNCNNVSSPVVAGGKYLHFGTTGGRYYVLRTSDGALVREINCGEPIFSAPVAAGGRVYFATLGSRLYALKPDGTILWTWDAVKELFGFSGNRWDGASWLKHLGRRVGNGEQFCCSRNIAVSGNTVILPAGGRIIWLKDAGSKPVVEAVWNSRLATMALSAGPDGAVYRQWHILDNRGGVSILRLRGGKVVRSEVPGTVTTPTGTASLGFSSVSIRGKEIYRTRPEEGFGLCRHTPGAKEPQVLPGSPSITPPIVVRNAVISCGLDGTVQVISLSDPKRNWTFRTPFGRAVTAPPAVCGGRIYAGCEDGYLYVLGPGGKAPLPKKDLEVWRIRTPLKGPGADPRFDRFTSFCNFANTNWFEQGLRPPFRLRWIRRFAGSAKHVSTFGGGRMYTHTAEGQIFAVEQTTGRLLWRVYFPGVHISYTSPLYRQGKVLVPQAGFKRCRLRCLSAETGRLIWEAPFAGSPSWNRQVPPVVYGDLAFYAFSTGRYGPFAPEDPDEKIPWLFEHQDNPRFPQSHHPLLRAYDLKTGAIVWERDFYKYGSGGDDASLCLLNGTLYYSCYFGHSPRARRGIPGPRGLTAALDPRTGSVRWLTTKYFIHGGCALSGEAGRLYLGGYNRIEKGASLVWCINAADGSLVWRSDPVSRSIKVVTITPKFLFTHSQYEHGYVLDKQTGKIINGSLLERYKCTAFTAADNYLFGSNLDIWDMRDPRSPRLIWTGPRLDPSECIGAFASNGRIYYTCQGAGLQACLVPSEKSGSR